MHYSAHYINVNTKYVELFTTIGINAKKVVNYNNIINSKYCGGVVDSTGRCVKPLFSPENSLNLFNNTDIKNVDFGNGINFMLLNVSITPKFYEYFGVKTLNLPNYFIFDVFILLLNIIYIFII
jgi:hypothetical protein